MNLYTYLSEVRGRRRELAEALGMSPDYLWQIATEWKGRKAGHETARAIEAATNGAVTRHDLRPDIFGTPEQADAA